MSQLESQPREHDEHVFLDTPPLITEDNYSQSRPKWLYAILVVLIFIIIALAVSLGVVLVSDSSKSEETWQHLSTRIRSSMFGMVRPKRMIKDLRSLAKTVHWSGTPENVETANYIEQQLKNANVDKVTLHHYNVLLSYPDVNVPNTFEMRFNGSDWIQLSNGLGERKGPSLAQKQMSSEEAPHWWNGYAKPGTATGTLVYANYGRKEDYDKLETVGVSLQGTIVITRYGKLWRGAKVFEAEKRGAVGAIIFNDPYDYGAPEGVGPDHVFPKDVFLPADGAQRGTLLQTNGDPLTPFIPSKNYTLRTKSEDQLRAAFVLPNIPVMPMGYRDAWNVIQSMDGPRAPADFVGGMNLTYRVTGSDEYRINVHGVTERRPIVDVCGWIWGRTEPDRYVVYGNHFDAWTNGAIDPNSGTTMQLEVARVYTETMSANNWRPQRTVVFCFWDAEEYGLIGSWEWMEEHLKMIEGRAVAVINTDIAVGGNVTITSAGMPSMNRIMLSALEKVENPNYEQQAMGLKNMWQSLEHICNGSIEGKGMPFAPCLKTPGSGSDHYGFMAYAGVPVIDTTYDCITMCKSGYALYHSMYEVPWTVENLLDKGFLRHKAMAQVVLEMGRSIADAPVIPLGIDDYSKMIDASVDNLRVQLSKQGNLSKVMTDFDEIFSSLKMASSELITVANGLQSKVDSVNANKIQASSRQVEMLNKRVTDFERSFVAPRGLYPERSDVRHVIFVNSLSDSYAGTTFAGVTDTAGKYVEATKSGNSTAAAHWLQRCTESLTELHYALESAQITLAIDGWELS